MEKLSKEKIGKWVAEAERVLNAGGAGTPERVLAHGIIAMSSALLAAHEQEPIGAFHISGGTVEATTDYCKDGEWPVQDGIVEVYAHPAPVPAVPDEVVGWVREENGDSRDPLFLCGSVKPSIGKAYNSQYFPVKRAAMLNQAPVMQPSSNEAGRVLSESEFDRLNEIINTPRQPGEKLRDLMTREPRYATEPKSELLQRAEKLVVETAALAERIDGEDLRAKVRADHAEWAIKTFGNTGPVGPLKHLSKEALETSEAPHDLHEWADMQFLFWDAQRKAGVTDEQITAAMVEKLEINKARQWGEVKDGEPVLHIKEGEKPDTCEWSYDDTEHKWDGKCGASWTFFEDGPEENRMKFCPGCGKPVSVVHAGDDE